MAPKFCQLRFVALARRFSLKNGPATAAQRICTAPEEATQAAVALVRMGVIWGPTAAYSRSALGDDAGSTSRRDAGPTCVKRDYRAEGG